MTRKSQRILIIDDSPEIRIALAAVLGHEDYELAEAADGHSGLEVARQFAPDLVVLDLGLPDIDGIEVCRGIRAFSTAYVIMLTGRDTEDDVISGLAVGADDYMTKPFSPKELAARARAAFRRSGLRNDSAHARAIQRYDSIAVDVDYCEVSVDGVPVALRPDEIDLLVMLMQEPEAVHSRADLLESVWGVGVGADDPLVDECVADLRTKLGDTNEPPRFIERVGDLGYRMARRVPAPTAIDTP